jgi:ornithine cyclodeaminase/alanine dehydrogenase-like protein (mu-crystallin family)
MPAFDPEGGGIVKLASVFPGNRNSGLPTIQAAIVVFSANGTPTAILDGAVITRRRTGAASALASTFLSCADSSHLLIIGTGALAPSMAEAHCAVRPITHVSVWGRNAARADAAVAAIRTIIAPHIDVTVAPALEAAVAHANIISCCTSSASPVLAGRWLRPGTFVDLVGSFSPSKRESDDDVVGRARIFVDTFEGAFAEAGDVLEPLARGVIHRERVEAQLADLVTGHASGRVGRDEIIVFKSVGTALEDLAAVGLLMASAAHDTGDN